MWKLKALVGFQPGEGPSRDLLLDCKTDGSFYSFKQNRKETRRHKTVVRWTIQSEYWQDELPHSRPPIHLHSRMILRSPPQQNTSITALLCWRFNLYTFEMITWYPMDSVNLSLLAIHRRFLSVKVTFVISIKWKYGLYLMTTDGVAMKHKVPLFTI